MTRNRSDPILILIIITSVLSLYLINKLIKTSNFSLPEDYVWVVHGLRNILGYSTIMLPGLLVYTYIKRTDYLNKPGQNSYIRKLLNAIYGDEELTATAAHNNAGQPAQRTPFHKAILLMWYFCGLQVSFLLWGVLQEKVMTRPYTNSAGETATFRNSQFLVFVNRILAFCISGCALWYRRTPRHRCPLYKYAFCSLSNVLSSWCQYEALKYVSFLHQVLSKASKTIPVMLMGYFVSGIRYKRHEYATALILSFGMLIFMLDTGNDQAKSSVTTASGALLLLAYVAFDSFTSNWQGALFAQYGVRPLQMMCAVNLCSCALTATALLQQDGFVDSLDFMWRFPAFVIDCALLSACSGAGQLFIFRTLADFGPFVFALITTVRQGFSVLLSCIIYGHKVQFWGGIGLVLVFASILLRIYCGHRLKAAKRRTDIGGTVKV